MTPGSGEFTSHVDLSVMYQQIGCNLELMRSLVAKFHATHSQERKELQELFEQKSTKEFSLMAHKIKGATAVLGATELSQICAKMQNIDEHTPWTDVEELMSQFKKHSDSVLDYVAEYAQE